ncbi:MAG: translation initiation factor IF-2 subunit beta [Candidatus Methanoperedens sp.]|jgi:translation initiation factor 2 subunit 2|nr:translation initiation factor IF-2 subunit beta [Candidatus Methanoperedens sp.]PKL53567.1 MAG: translation initiation factor IF-2 subunit beta [Candidatus Methanoperedenaceae archaeon HGW-Methanoperedenaceae-1]
MNDYAANLDRALSQLPELKNSGERFKVPEPKLLTEGKTTVLENFANIADILNRDPDHVFKFLLKELGTAGKKEGTRVIFQGRFNFDVVSQAVEQYVNEYVTCSECGRPDTHLLKSDRILTLRCDACGGHRPVKKRQVSSIVKEDALIEGNTYEVRIDAKGRKGDGIAKVDKYTIYVPNGNKGDIIVVKIKKITGNLAFADFIEKKG